MASKPKETARARLRAQFDLLVTIYRHPVRLAVSLAVPLMIFPELETVSGWLTGFHGAFAGVVTMFFLMALIFLPQFFMSWLDCRAVWYEIYDDHLSFTENFILRTPIHVYYRSVTDVHIAVNPAQRLRGLADIVLTTQLRTAVRTVDGGAAPITGQAQHYAIRDIPKKKAPSVLKLIQKLVEEKHAAAAQK